MSNSIIEPKSFNFAIRIVKLNNYLNTQKKEFILSKQLLRSGTSIGANVAEAQQAQSKTHNYPLSIFHFQLNMRIWRNWQTRQIQVLIGATRCRFNSCYPHQTVQIRTLSQSVKGSDLLFLQTIRTLIQNVKIKSGGYLL